MVKYQQPIIWEGMGQTQTSKSSVPLGHLTAPPINSDMFIPLQIFKLLAHNGQLTRTACIRALVPRPATILQVPRGLPPARRHPAQLLSRNSLPEVSRGSEDAAKQTMELVVGVYGPLGGQSFFRAPAAQEGLSDRRIQGEDSCPPGLKQAGPHGPRELWY